MGKLVHVVDGANVREYPLNEGVFKIGRNVDNNIQLDDDAVSGYNTEIAVKPSQYMEGLHDFWLKDLQSTNGTRVNGKKVERRSLEPNDVVAIMGAVFRVVETEAATPADAAPGAEPEAPAQKPVSAAVNVRKESRPLVLPPPPGLEKSSSFRASRTPSASNRKSWVSTESPAPDPKSMSKVTLYDAITAPSRLSTTSPATSSNRGAFSTSLSLMP